MQMFKSYGRVCRLRQLVERIDQSRVWIEMGKKAALEGGFEVNSTTGDPLTQPAKQCHEPTQA